MPQAEEGFGVKLRQALFSKPDTDIAANIVSNLLAKQQEGKSASSPLPF